MNPPLNGRAAAPGGLDGLRNLPDDLRAARAARIWPEIADPTSAQRAAMPHRVDCGGVTVRDMQEAFAAELHRLKRWCREHCEGAFSVEPIRGPAAGRDTGRRFRFAEQGDAAFFRLSCL